MVFLQACVLPSPFPFLTSIRSCTKCNWPACIQAHLDLHNLQMCHFKDSVKSTCTLQFSLPQSGKLSENLDSCKFSGVCRYWPNRWSFSIPNENYPATSWQRNELPVVREKLHFAALSVWNGNAEVISCQQGKNNFAVLVFLISLAR